MSKGITAVVLSAFVLSGCNMMKGLGRDISSAGNKTTQTAAETQAKM